jgi:hypothetical protein
MISSQILFRGGYDFYRGKMWGISGDNIGSMRNKIQ